MRKVIKLECGDTFEFEPSLEDLRIELVSDDETYANYVLATPSQADAIAIALIQATPAVTCDAANAIEGWDYLDQPGVDRVALGLALIRSAAVKS